MKVLLDIKDNKVDFVMELLKNLSFVKAKPISEAKAKLLAGLKKSSTEKEFNDFWNGLSQQSFQKAYGENEPDYADVKVAEPNPKYGL